MQLTESCAMTPAAAVSGFYIGHPAAAYFAIPKIARDQLEDWAAAQRHVGQGCGVLAGPLAVSIPDSPPGGIPPGPPEPLKL